MPLEAHPHRGRRLLTVPQDLWPSLQILGDPVRDSSRPALRLLQGVSCRGTCSLPTMISGAADQAATSCRRLRCPFAKARIERATCHDGSEIIRVIRASYLMAPLPIPSTTQRCKSTKMTT